MIISYHSKEIEYVRLRKMDNKRGMQKIEFVLQMAFYVLIVAMIVVFFLYRNTETPRLFLIPAGAALLVRVVSYILRYLNR